MIPREKSLLKNLYKLLSSVEGYPKYEDCVTYAIAELEAELEQEPVIDEIRDEIEDTLYVDSLIFTELYDFKNGKIDVDDVIEEFNRVTRAEVLKIIDKYKTESEE